MRRHTFTVYVDVSDDDAAAFDGEAVARVLVPDGEEQR